MNSTRRKPENFLSKKNIIEEFDKSVKNRIIEKRDVLPTWCPGCGDFTVLHGLYDSAVKLGIDSKDLVVVSGIGCSSRFPFFVKSFGFHTVHGRAIPVATGVKLGNPKLTVVVTGGDGDGLGIGGGHLPHAARHNINLTYLLMDNCIYGLTKGQVSPTSPVGMISATTPYGNIANPIDACVLSLSYGASFVARAFSKDRESVSTIIKKAIAHQGFSIVQIISPCVEFNKTITYKSVNELITDLPDDYVPNNKYRALELADNKEKIYHGILFQERRQTLEEKIQNVKERVYL